MSAEVHIHKHEVKGKNLLLSIILNVIITASQVVGGLLSGSLALISDALHNFSDVLSLTFSFIAHKMSRRKASLNHTFGYKRAGIMAAFINALTLIIIGVFLIFEAIHRFTDPIIIESGLVIGFAILGILANGSSVLLLKSDAASSLNMRSAYIHLLTDTLASVAVLIGGILMKYFQIYWVDSILTMIIAFYLIVVGADLILKSTRILMLFTPKEVDLKSLIRDVNRIPGVKKLHHIHVWYLNDEELHLEAHLDCKEDLRMSEFNALLAEIENLLFTRYHINHINIQPEFRKNDSKSFIVQD